MPGHHISEWEGNEQIAGRTDDPISMVAQGRDLLIAYKGHDNNSLWMNRLSRGSWQGEVRLRGRTSHAPALAIYRREIWLAYRGWDGDSLWINSYDGRNWRGETLVPGEPNGSPAMAVRGGRLYVAYPREDHRIGFKAFDGSRWTDPPQPSGRTNRSPALCHFHGRLALAYKGWNDTSLWVNWFDGTRWAEEWRLQGRTDLGPTLADYRGHLFLSYKGAGDQTLWLNALRWIRWEGEVRLDAHTPSSPSLAVHGNQVKLAYRDGDSRIWMKSFDATRWGDHEAIPGTTNCSPAATVYRGRIYVAYRERRLGRLLVLDSPDGRQWRVPPSPVVRRISDSPALATWRGLLHLAYREHKTDTMALKRFDGRNWSEAEALAGRTSHGPAVTAHEDKLFLAYKGWNDTSIWLNHCSWDKDGNRWVWHGERRVSDCSTDASPALVSFRGQLGLAYKAVDESRIYWKGGYWSSSTGDIDWDPARRSIGHDAADGPALTAFGDQCYVLYRNSRSNQAIYLDVQDKRHGGLGRLRVADQRTDAAPALACKEGRLYAVYKTIGNQLGFRTHRILQAWSPDEAGLSMDANGHEPKTASGEPLNHSINTEHLQVFWNESEPDERVSPDDARLVADQVELAWELFSNPALAEGHAFHINLATTQYSGSRDKLPVWIRGYDTSNAFKAEYRLHISPSGGCTGCATLNWGAQGYAGGTANHELGHCMNKSYSWHFNSGGSGLRWINEGIPDVYRAVLSTGYPGIEGAGGSTPKRLIGHIDLSGGNASTLYSDSGNSLLLTSYKGRRFWYSLIRAYTRVHNRALVDQPNWGYYQWNDVPFPLRESFRAVAGSADASHVRRLPGRDILLAIQTAFEPCFPEGQSTPICGAGQEPDAAPARVPGEGELFRLVPLAMQKLDEALAGFWTTVESPQLPYRAFREFLERNFLAVHYDRRTEVDVDGSDYRLQSLGAHYHRLRHEMTISAGTTITFTADPRDLPDGQWAIAGFHLDGNSLIPVHRWRLGAGPEQLLFDTTLYPDPVVIVAGLYFGYQYSDLDGDGTADLVSEVRTYRREIHVA